VKVTELGLPGVLLLEARVYPDVRGAFCEVFQAERYAALGIQGPFVQDNLSSNRPWSLRGMHWQARYPQGKLLTVIAGSILDVVVEVRPSSPVFGRHVAVELRAGSGRQLWVPPGYAHGFLAGPDGAEVLYKVTDVWHGEDSFGVRWDDPTLALPWPAGVTPVLSPADAALPAWSELPPERLPRGVGPA
jgi:dTDP-4-dehydrorhamnose 3,5-epimerase